MRKVQTALCGAVLILVSGCELFSPMRYDAKKFDPQCPAWQELPRRGDKSAQMVAESKGMEAYYEYYMCLEMRYVGLPSLERMQYFLDNVNEFVRIAPDKLRNPRHWKELYVLSSILWRIHMHKYYNVRNDSELLSVWGDSIRRKDKYQSGFNESMYLDVVQFSY